MPRADRCRADAATKPIGGYCPLNSHGGLRPTRVAPRAQRPIPRRERQAARTASSRTAACLKSVVALISRPVTSSSFSSDCNIASTCTAYPTARSACRRSSLGSRPCRSTKRPSASRRGEASRGTGGAVAKTFARHVAICVFTCARGAEAGSRARVSSLTGSSPRPLAGVRRWRSVIGARSAAWRWSR